MASGKEKYTLEICKLVPGSGRLKERIVGRVLACWKEELQSGKSKVMGAIIDGTSFQNVLTFEAWSPADQAHAETNVKPMLGQVVAFENCKVVSKGKSTVFYSKQIKMAYDRNTVIKHLQEESRYGKEFPGLQISDIAQIADVCAISLIVCVDEAAEPTARNVDGVEKTVTNLKVAFGDRKIDAAFWGIRLAQEMATAKRGDVYRFDWMTLMPQGQGMFKLTTSGGAQMQN